MALPFLEQYITREAVLKILIHYRCKEAERIQRVLVVDDLAVKKEDDEKKDEKLRHEELYGLFPPRRKWIHVGFDNRKNLTQIDKNEKNLLYTVLKEEGKEGEHAEWYKRLDARINKIVSAALTSHVLFARPTVAVIEKKRNEKDKTIECRPICMFKTLDERIYASLYNRVFTHLLDNLFYEKSFAFRVAKKGDPQMLHLKAVRDIKEFRRTHTGNLWVAECDMKKFYDTLDHDLIKRRFSQMLHWQKRDGFITIEEWRILKRVIYSYVNSFSFYQDVYRYNKKPSNPIWKNIRNSRGYTKHIKWITGDIEAKRTAREWPYRTKEHDKYQLGVPQGGALSGIIANVMMHFTDMKLRNYWEGNKDFLYVRFCDDMIMMSVDKIQLKGAFECYQKSIETSHLYMHPPVAFTGEKMRAFWDGKTRPPYKWGVPAKDVMPWITFVGYDVNWEGDTRIRRSSLDKEIKKQYEKEIEIEHLLSTKGGRNPQWSRAYIMNSLHKRLIGMSVGRVQIWDYKTHGNNYSWARAFTELTDNKWARWQLRRLDKHRSQMMKRLGNFLLSLNYDEIKPSDKREHTDALFYYGKPFSYYGQVLKKW